jgi:hypothetical protein
MKMNEWVRHVNIEESFESLHNVKPQVYVGSPVERNINKVKLVNGLKEAFITEKLEKGLTKYAELICEGIQESFSRVYDAEVRAKELLYG